MDNWTSKYEANDLPENATPAWTSNSDPFVLSTIEINPAGNLHILNPSSSEVADWSIDTLFNDATGSTFEVKTKITTGDTIASNVQNTVIILTTDLSNVQLQFYSDGIVLWDGALGALVDSYSFDTSADHVYRVTIKDNFAKVYVDDVLKLSGSFTSAPTGGALIEFIPSGGQGTTIENSWDYIYYNVDGAIAPIGKKNE